jgi:hypothetical protein
MKINNIIFLAVILLAGACKKDGTIATKMSATIDGKGWATIVRETVLVASTNNLVITGTSSLGEILVVTVYGSTTGTYELTTSIPLKTDCLASFKSSITAANEDIYISTTGKVVISKIDKTAKKVSGTFEFTLVRKLTETKSVTNGVFTDLTYVDQ